MMQNFTCTDGWWFLFRSSADPSWCWREVQIPDHHHVCSHLLENTFSNSQFGWLLRLHLCLLFRVPPLSAMCTCRKPSIPSYRTVLATELYSSTAASSNKFSHEILTFQTTCLNETWFQRRKGKSNFLTISSFIHSLQVQVLEVTLRICGRYRQFNSNLSFFGIKSLSNNTVQLRILIKHINSRFNFKKKRKGSRSL